MGDAKGNHEVAEELAREHEALSAVAGRISHALRRLARAASAHLGGDCYLHAELGRVLLADEGFGFRTRVGFAAWRVGPGDSDVLAHRPQAQVYLPPGAGLGFAYHAWLESDRWLVDFTTYQLTHKAQMLDASDGGHTRVDWCPDYLLLSRAELRGFREVARAPLPGIAYYEGVDELTTEMAKGYALPESDLTAARLLMRHDDMRVIGPNTDERTPARDR